MRVSVDRLRKGLLAGAGLLLLVIAGFLTYAHYRTHRFLQDLPHKLGADIRQEANAFTWSQTVKGRTIFTVHAAKAIQHKNGKYTMRDVGIVVYGKGNDQTKRVDRIYGKEFELDQAEGIVKAMGEVHLDLQAPANSGSAVPSSDSAPAHDEDLRNTKLIHVKTSGLVYLQKLGVAATDQEIEFEYNGLTGHATGADYNADTGVLLLHSAVKISGLDHGKPILLTANRGELNRMDRQILLTQAKFVTIDRQGNDLSGRQTVEAQRATAFLRANGSAEKLVGEGGVTITSGDGSKITSERGEMVLTEANKPQSMWMTRNFHYSLTAPDRNATGEATGMRTSFDPQGQPVRMVLQGGVHLLQHNAPAETGQLTTARELTASNVELEIATEQGKRSWVRKARASGDAFLSTSEPEKEQNGIRQSVLRGDLLTAQFESQDGKENLVSVRGKGATSLEQRRPDGSVQASSADLLDATFRHDGAGATAGSYSGGRDQIDTAALTGHVVVRKLSGAKHQPDGPAFEDRVTAQNATYDGRTGHILLTGAVELKDAQGVLWAERITLNQRTGDASAAGTIKANFQQGASGEPVHILADRADLKKSTDTATFYGAAHPARLWEGSSQIEAPVLQFDRAKQRLIVHGAASVPGSDVHTVLVSAGERDQHRSPAVIRISSQEMDYSNEQRTAQFIGGVKVDSPDGTMHGRRAIAYFSPQRRDKQSDRSARDPAFLQSGVERVVVDGDIVIRQQGRQAVGDQLVYTAKDGLFILTGTAQHPPRVMDALRGTITGRELRFREQDTSVVISNGDANETGPRVRTETRVKKER